MITYLKHPRLNHPQLVAAWPGMGFVAVKTVNCLLEDLSPERFAYINPGDYFSISSVVVENGVATIPALPEGNFYSWKNSLPGGDLILFMGEAQPSARLQLKQAREIVTLAKGAGAVRIFTFAAAPSPIQHKDTPRIWGVANSPRARGYLLKNDIQLLQHGQVSGLNGLLLGAAAREGLPGVCLLGDIPYYTVNLENPRVTRAILETMEKLLPIKLDYFHLDREIRRSDKEISQMGKKAQETMASFFQGEIDEDQDQGEGEFEEAIADETGETEEAPEEESDEHKVLPEPARRRIEELFRRMKRDISQAPSLKRELDKWGVYQEYEDRFLDLFRNQNKQQDN